MSTHRSFEKICVVVTAFMLLITVLFMNGSSLGIEMIIDEDTELHAHTVYFTENDLNGQWSTSGATVITLNGDSAGISGKGAYFYDGNLVIRNGGKYVLSGKLTDGSIVVKTHKNSKVWLLLDGVELCCSDDACLRIDKADKVFLTLAEGSENRMESGTNYSAEALADKTGGVIFAHDARHACRPQLHDRQFAQTVCFNTDTANTIFAHDIIKFFKAIIPCFFERKSNNRQRVAQKSTNGNRCQIAPLMRRVNEHDILPVVIINDFTSAERQRIIVCDNTKI